jgi:phosphoribosylaminoimidazole-succinocarboxamide synthase
MLVKKAEPLPVECIVRGYLAGSGWKEYQKNGTVTGIKLPDGLLESSELPEPIFTPSTKAESGHDENIPFEKMVEIIGEELAAEVRDVSLSLYSAARDHAKNRGIILADTKFEFGIADGKLILIDEVLTPDSSRFWPLDVYEPGKPQPSFDKQFVRDYLSSLDWNKEPPAPELPEEIVEKTREKYFQALDLLSK